MVQKKHLSAKSLSLATIGKTCSAFSKAQKKCDHQTSNLSLQITMYEAHAC